MKKKPGIEIKVHEVDMMLLSAMDKDFLMMVATFIWWDDDNRRSLFGWGCN